MTISSLQSMQHAIRSAISMDRGKSTEGRDWRRGFHPSLRWDVKKASGISICPASLRRRWRQWSTESGRGYLDGEEESGRQSLYPDDSLLSLTLIRSSLSDMPADDASEAMVDMRDEYDLLSSLIICGGSISFAEYSSISAL